MTWEAYVTIAVILIAFTLFATEYFSVDHIAIGIMVSLAITSVLTPAESVEGFANEATITVAAMFVLGDALIKTGIIESVGPLFRKLLSRGYRQSIFSLSSGVGGISAFINNTPVVATFIPIIADATRSTSQNASKYLIPLSYGAIIGGTCTLIGTSTNLLVHGIARDRGLDGFSMFTFLPLGLIFFAVGVVYLTLFSGKLLPERRGLKEFENQDELRDYLTEIEVIKRLDSSMNEAEDDVSIGKVFETDQQEDVVVEQVLRKKKSYEKPDADFVLENGDVLLVRGNLSRIKKILKNEYLEMAESLGERRFPEKETRMVEIVVLPNSGLVGQKLDDLDFFTRYQSRVLAIRQRGKQRFNNLGRVRLRAGDVLLLQTSEKGYKMLYKAERKRTAPFLSLSESGIEKVKKGNLLKVGLTITGVIVLASLDMLPIMTGALAGIFILVLGRIISMEQVYRAIDWKVIILLAGALSLGAAMSKSGLSEQIARLMEEYIATNFGPIAVISVLYITTSILTESMSNNAAAALLAPIAISVAQSLQLDPLPFLLAITFAGSASFMTPIGYQTNTMVYSAGNYNFKDFLRIGVPLDLIFWVIATFLIPVIYPF